MYIYGKGAEDIIEMQSEDMNKRYEINENESEKNIKTNFPSKEIRNGDAESPKQAKRETRDYPALKLTGSSQKMYCRQVEQDHLCKSWFRRNAMLYRPCGIQQVLQKQLSYSGSISHGDKSLLSHIHCDNKSSQIILYLHTFTVPLQCWILHWKSTNAELLMHAFALLLIFITSDI